MVRTEIAVHGGYVVLLINDEDDGGAVQIVMTADQCREYVNGLGRAILCLSKTGAMAI